MTRSAEREWRSIYWFVALSFLPTWVLWLFLALLHIEPSKTVRFALFGTTGMYFPGIAAIVVRYFDGDLSGTTLNRLGIKRYYWWAWFLFPSLIAATILVDLFAGGARVDWSLQQLHSIRTSAPSSLDSLGRFAIAQLVLAVLLGPIIHGLTTIGEELGWRDFLLPRLIRAGLSQWAALCATGAVWGLWHVPVILLGLEYVSHPFLGIPMFTAYAILVGIILGWLRLASGSVWIATLAHGSINAVQRAALVLIVGYNQTISGTLGSLTGWLVLSVFIAWLAMTHRLPVKYNEAV